VRYGERLEVEQALGSLDCGRYISSAFEESEGSSHEALEASRIVSRAEGRTGNRRLYGRGTGVSHMYSFLARWVMIISALTIYRA